MIIDDSIERKYEVIKVLLMNLEDKYYYFNQVKVTDEDYEKYYYEIIHIANKYEIDSNIKAHNGSKKITSEYVQSTENSYEKFLYAKKLYDRMLITANNIKDIKLLLKLNYYLNIITNVKNFYFVAPSKEEAIKKSLEGRYKRFNAIFKDEIKALAMDYRKFYDINRFSEKSFHDDEKIRINQKQGLEFVEIGNLICNNKLKEAFDRVIKIGRQVKDVPWPK